MAHEVETMAYAVARVPPPWWNGMDGKLGNPVSNDMSVEDMLIAAGLNTTNVSEPLYVQLEDGSFKCLDHYNKDNSHYRAVMRKEDGYVHSIMTEDYNIVQNYQLMEFLREYVIQSGMTLETAGALKHGSLVWVMAGINAGFELPGNDLNQTKVLISTSHDGSQETMGQFTNISVVCANTLRMAQGGKKGRSFSIKHSAIITSELIENAKKQMGLAKEQAEKLAETALAMSQVTMDNQQTYEYVAQLVQPNLLTKVVSESEGVLAQILAEESKRLDAKDFTKVGKSILLDITMGPGADLESRKDRLWGVLNGVTHYVDHTAGRNRDSALTSAWFGQGAELKAKAYDLAVATLEARR